MSEENEKVLYCYECGHIGMVKHPARACCPDAKGTYVAPEVAEQAKAGFAALYLTNKPEDPNCKISEPTSGKEIALDTPLHP